MIAKKSPLILEGQIINSLFGYIGLFFIIRFIGLQQWGFLSFSLAFIGVLSIFSDLGFNSAHLRFMSMNDPDRAKYNGSFLTLKFITTFGTVLIILAALYVWIDVLHRGFQSPVEYYSILILIPYFAFNRLKDFYYITFNAKMQAARMMLPQIVEAVFRNSAFIYMGLMYKFRISIFMHVSAAIIFAIIYSFSYFIFFIVSYFLGRPWHIKKPEKTIIKKYITLALPLAASSIIATISGNIDKVLIQFFWHASATGAYAALQRITMPIITFSTALSVFFIPLLTREETKNGFNDNISVFERTISLFILPLVIIFIALRIFVANLWSANLIPYSTLLIFMSLANYLNVINSPYTSGLIVRGLTINIGKITLISISSNIILDFILIPKSIFGITFFSLGVIGAAVATFIAMIIEAVLFRFYVIKIEKSKINMKIFRQIIPASVQFIFLYLVSYYVRPYSVFLFLIFSIISIAIFFSLSIKMGEIKKSVIIDFIRELNPFKLSRTLKNE